ncbi:S-layer homology domain-containing protein [Bhargavaea ullalensis]|uniref:SLH domain-containing protein n=1 Tax=Bhargavaea ullalensis TaxID=1265685 RepID=A0ABV2GAU7_9BACL
MAMKTKSYSKFMTGAVTAAMVASAVAPVAAAGQDKDVAAEANSSFTDIGPSSSHFVNVQEARELGFLSGYDDGTFKPNKILNRGDVTKMLGKYVVATSGKTLSEYVKDNKIADVPNFTDVPNDARDKELVTYSKIVKEAGIFEGSNNNLMATKEMNRDQIAVVLVRAFDLKEKAGDTKVIDGKGSAYEKEIAILLENGVSDANPYKPFNKTSRAQFASFLVRAYKVSMGMDPSLPLSPIASVDAVNDITIKVGETPNLPTRVGVTLENGKKSTALVKWDTKNLDNTKVGTYKLTGDVAGTDIDATVNVIVQQASVDSGISDVKAINPNTVEVTFSKALDKDFIREAEQNGGYFATYKFGDTVRSTNAVQSAQVNFSADGKTAEVVMKRDFEPGERYYVSLLDGSNMSVAKELHTFGPVILREASTTPDYSVSAVSDKVYIEFSEKMTDAALAATNFEVYDNAGQLLGTLDQYTNGNSAVASEWTNAITKNRAVFTLSPDATKKLLAGQTYQIRVKTNVPTASGKYLNKDTKVATVTTPTVAEATPKATMARVTGTKNIVLVFDKDVSKQNLDDLASLVTVTTSTGKTVETAKMTADQAVEANEVTLTLPEANLDQALTYNVGIPANLVKNAVFPNATNQATTGVKATAQDNVQVKSMTASLQVDAKDRESADLVLTFDQRPTLESLQKALADGTLRIREGATTYQPKAGATFNVKYVGSDATGKTVVIEGVNNKFAAGSTDFDFVPTKGSNYTIIALPGAVAVDAFGTTPKLTNQSALTATATGVSVSAPMVDGVTLDSAEKITVEFAEDLDPTIDLSKISVQGFVADRNGFYSAQTNLKGSRDLKATVSGNTLTITPAQNDIKFVTSAIDNIVSFDQNALVAKESQVAIGGTGVVADDVEDNAAPIILSAQAWGNNTDVLLTYSEGVFTEGDVAPLFRTGGTVANSSVGETAQPINQTPHNMLVLRFEKPFAGSIVNDLYGATVDYRPGTTTYVRDEVGNKSSAQTIQGIQKSMVQPQ